MTTLYEAQCLLSLQDVIDMNELIDDMTRDNEP